MVRKPRKAATRSETVTVRLEPKLRYLAEVAARKYHRTLSSLIETAVNDYLGTNDSWVGPENQTLPMVLDYLWDADGCLRFLKLAHTYEHLLSYEEQKVLGVIKWNSFFMTDSENQNSVYKKLGDLPRSSKPDPGARERPSPDVAKVHKHWPQILAVARGEASPDTLPAAESEAAPESPRPARKPRTKKP